VPPETAMRFQGQLLRNLDGTKKSTFERNFKPSRISIHRNSFKLRFRLLDIHESENHQGSYNECGHSAHVVCPVS